ncbi:YggT family protein [Zavarzinia compransoris]|uniref:YggT family protein n=1 Tax=Zavarzinia marina TaxID=2911065 RepID=UPI001F3F8167|nr:YggT family protein [Zavarzinia marina]MCF4165384.1 YggT family protein [Zavarzinia marina]
MIALVQTIDLVLNLYSWVLIISAIMSWLIAFNVINPYSPAVRSIGQGLYVITEPLLRPIRQVIPTAGGIDFAPLVLLIIIFFLRRFIPEILLGI